MSTIPLATGFDEKNLRFPVYLSRKYDGVPIRIDFTEDGWSIRSRSDKPILSMNTVVEGFYQRYRDDKTLPVPITFVGEIITAGNPDQDFSITCGVARRHADAGYDLELQLFECSHGKLFEDRFFFMKENISNIAKNVHVAGQVPYQTLDDLKQAILEFQRDFPQAEGAVARNFDDPWVTDKRSKGYQKILQEPTIDLEVVDFHEAIDKHGQPKGMVGRIVALYNGREIGIGPGSMVHSERKALWEKYKIHGSTDRIGIAQIKYKPGYKNALRQGMFQHWRPDKEEPDA